MRGRTKEEREVRKPSRSPRTTHAPRTNEAHERSKTYTVLSTGVTPPQWVARLFLFSNLQAENEVKRRDRPKEEGVERHVQVDKE
jgi:hypothetical protein